MKANQLELLSSIIWQNTVSKRHHENCNICCNHALLTYLCLMGSLFNRYPHGKITKALDMVEICKKFQLSHLLICHLPSIFSIVCFEWSVHVPLIPYTFASRVTSALKTALLSSSIVISGLSIVDLK